MRTSNSTKHKKSPSFSTSPPIEKYIRENSALSQAQTTCTEQLFKTHVGEYRLIKKIGKGSGGEVFLGRRKGKEVAIKIVRKSEKKPQWEKMARQEHCIMQHLSEDEQCKKNKHIVEHISTLENEKEIAIIMDYAKGGDLFELVKKRGRLHESEAWRLFRQLIQAVNYIHGKSVCHRDIKPCNIFLDKARNVVLGDWGHARTWNSFDKTSENCGSLCYSAPEVLLGDQNYVGPEIDLWSCGTVLYVMLTGQRPFWATNTDDVYTNIQLGRYEQLPSDISPEVCHLLASLLATDPLKRATMMDVLAHPWVKTLPARHRRCDSSPALQKLVKPLPPHPNLAARCKQRTYDAIDLTAWRSRRRGMTVSAYEGHSTPLISPETLSAFLPPLPLRNSYPSTTTSTATSTMSPTPLPLPLPSTETEIAESTSVEPTMPPLPRPLSLTPPSTSIHRVSAKSTGQLMSVVAESFEGVYQPHMAIDETGVCHEKCEALVSTRIPIAVDL